MENYQVELIDACIKKSDEYEAVMDQCDCMSIDYSNAGDYCNVKIHVRVDDNATFKSFNIRESEFSDMQKIVDDALWKIGLDLFCGLDTPEPRGF